MKDRASIHAAPTSSANTDHSAAFSQGILSSSARAFRDQALLSPLISTGRNGLRGHHVLRSPGALRLHPAFNDLNLSGLLINSELQGKPQDIHEPVLITRPGIIVSGFAEWHAAVCAGQAEVDCIEFELDADEALQLSLALHRPRATWNDFGSNWHLNRSSISNRRLLLTRSPVASTRAWQICQKLSTLMCGKKLPILPGSLRGLWAT